MDQIKIHFRIEVVELADKLAAQDEEDVEIKNDS